MKSKVKRNMNGKGSKRRPTQISKDLEDLRWKLAFGKHTEEQKAAIIKQIQVLEQNEQQ